MRTMDAQNGEEQKQSQNSRDPASTREGDGNAGEYDKGSIAEEDFGNMTKATAQTQGESKRDQHFQKSAEVIGVDVSARTSVRIRFDSKPNAVRVGEVLIDRITRNGHGKKYKSENSDLGKFL